MSELRSKVIRLAAASPELRPHLLPILKAAGYRYRSRGYGGGGYGGSYGSERHMINHIMDSRGVDREEAEQILTDIYDDVGHDRGLVEDAVYGNNADY